MVDEMPVSPGPVFNDSVSKTKEIPVSSRFDLLTNANSENLCMRESIVRVGKRMTNVEKLAGTGNGDSS